MMFSGLFDLEFRTRDIDKNGEILLTLDKTIDWELFRPDLQAVRNHVRAIGLVRARARIGLRNWACNLDRYRVLATG